MKKGFLLFKGWCHMTEHVQTTLAQIGNRSDEITGTVILPFISLLRTGTKESGNPQDLITFAQKIRQDSL